MDPPRIPLHTIIRLNGVNSPYPYNSPHPVKGSNFPIAGTAIPAAFPRPPKRIAPDLMGAFKEAVTGSDLTKNALVDILKKQ